MPLRKLIVLVAPEVISCVFSPQVKAMFPFKVGELNVAKGEVMTLVDKPNDDWWHVRSSNGLVGAAPANHLQEIEPRVVKKRVERRLTRQLSRTSVPQTKEIPSSLDPKQIAHRQAHISTAYIQLKNDAADKRKLFGEAVGVADFLRVNKKSEFFNKTFNVELEKPGQGARIFTGDFQKIMGKRLRKVNFIIFMGHIPA